MPEFSIISFLLGAAAFLLLDLLALWAILTVFWHRRCFQIWRRDGSLLFYAAWFRKRRPRAPVLQPGAPFDEPLDTPAGSSRPSDASAL